MSKPVLFGHPVSPFVRKARLLLGALEIDYDFEVLLPHADNEDFKKASPIGKIPGYKDDLVSTADSTVIAQHLIRYKGGESLLPDEPQTRADTLWLEEYADTVMQPAFGAHLFAEVVLAGRIFPREPIQEDIDKALNEEIPKIVKFMNGRLEGRDWLVTDQPVLADYAVGGQLMTLYHCGETVPDSAPALQAYAERFFALPVAQSLIAYECQVMNSIKYESPLAAKLSG